MSNKILLLIVLLLFCGGLASAQNKDEREHRIRKVQFPTKALEYIKENIKEAKRLRFYKEIDSAQVRYESKFKKDRLWYSIEFDKEGMLEDVKIVIKSVDIPNDSFENITTYLKNNFKKYRIRKIQQQYPISENEQMETTLINAFQNLMLPTITYELVVSGKKDRANELYEALFDAEGSFMSIRKSLPPNYDHVLY